MRYYIAEMLRNRFSQGFSTVVLIIIFVTVLGGIAGVVMMRPPSSSTPLTGERSGTENASDLPANDLSSTIPDIVGRGQNLECDWKLPSTGSENPFGAGKLYTTANKGRSSITGGTEGVTIDANAIYKDETAYSWVTVAGTTMGFKFDKEELDSMNSSMTAEQKQQAEQIRSEMIFSCKPWIPDESKFELPTGVEFK